MYSDELLDHFHHPRNVGEIPEATAVVEVTNPACGDLMKLWAVVYDARVVEVKFKVAGCVPAIACGSWLTEAIRGKTLEEIAGLTTEHVEAGVGGLPSASRHAAVLVIDALQHLLARLSFSAENSE